MYHWETGSKKKSGGGGVRRAGTVILHADDKVDLSFERLQKDHIHPRRGGSNGAIADVVLQQFAGRDDADDTIEKATQQNQHMGVKAPMLTAATAAALQSRNGFTALLPTQAQCYRGIFKGRDVILHSRTGSGKTLSYALPIIERHFIFERKETSPSPAATSAAVTSGPFLLIFVFSNELAAQTKSVLDKIYSGRNLKIGVAGFDDVVTTPCDVLIGLVSSLDEVIRGKKSGAGAKAKRGRGDGEPKDDDADDELLGEDDDGASSSSDEDEADDDVSGRKKRHVVDVSAVRAIVVDEVDTTLGPRFSSAGRRMKALLKYIRRANGSLSEGLMSDFRAHHYVLCGATIPNWVIKAGFLGIKKFYYQLVTIGTQKLPPQLECFAEKCHTSKRVDRAVEMLSPAGSGALCGKRVVVFGTSKQLDQLEARLAALEPVAVPKKKKKSGDEGGLSVRSLSTTRKRAPLPPSTPMPTAEETHRADENDRIRSISDFNEKRANVLLCTDLASRGLDFTDVAAVVMLSLPHHQMATEVFVHRAGRTARVGKPGLCLVLYDSPADDISMDAIAKTAHVAFKHTFPMAAGEASSSSREGANRNSVSPSVVKMIMTVRNPFSTQSQQSVPPPTEMLAKALGPDDYALLQEVEVKAGASGSQHVHFSVPVASAHIIKKKLWKYDVKEAV